MSDSTRYFGFGNRKESIAKVHLSYGTGKISICTGGYEERKTRNPEEYFCNKFLIDNFMQPINLTGKGGKVDVNVFLKGGGISAQSGAARLAVARALLEMDPDVKPLLRTYKLLTQDKRFKERKKVGKRGARRAPQFTKR